MKGSASLKLTLPFFALHDFCGPTPGLRPFVAGYAYKGPAKIAQDRRLRTTVYTGTPSEQIGERKKGSNH